MAKAIWNGVTVAESDETVIIEGNYYFPLSGLKNEYLEDSDQTSVCPWKGTASYYHVVVGGARNENAAWVYRNPKPEALRIKDHVAFWKGVIVEA